MRASPATAGIADTAASPAAATHATPGPARLLQYDLMGGRFRFRSDSPRLLDVVAAAYRDLPPHRFHDDTAGFDIDLRLRPPRDIRSGEPPPVRILIRNDLVGGRTDGGNRVVVAPLTRRARVIASADMLEQPYHLRYELIEFAVFVLAARVQGLAPLHAACVSRDGHGILLLGESGAGKSTLVLHALRQGFDLVSEDAVFVRPSDMRATGVANFVHVRADAVDGLDDPAMLRWIADAPVIRRRSGVEKHEADLRGAPCGIRPAAHPVTVVAVAMLSASPSPHGGVAIASATHAEVLACLHAGQPHARTQPGWDGFLRQLAYVPAYHLGRGRKPGDAVALLERLLG
jgi:hypothetical protein